MKCISESQAPVINMENRSRYSQKTQALSFVLCLVTVLKTQLHQLGPRSLRLSPPGPLPTYRGASYMMVQRCIIYDNGPANSASYMMDPLIDVLVFLFQVFDPSSPNKQESLSCQLPRDATPWQPHDAPPLEALSG